jgi:hypothetical protein
MIVVLVLAAVLGANQVLYVDSVDLTKDSNRISIGLSEPATYTVSPLSAGTGFRITVPNVPNVEVIPNYRRLSRVIDNITAFSDGRNAYVDIRTMAEYPYVHHLEGNMVRITLNPAAEPKPQPTPKARPAVPAQAKPEPAKQARLPEAAPRDTVSAPVAALPEQQPPKKPVPIRPPRSCPLTPKTAAMAIFIIAALAVLAFVIYWIVHTGTHRSQDDVSSGSTLILDQDTKSRLVLKLSSQGWKSREIARELKLSLKEVEHIISLSQMSGYPHEH